MECVLIQSCSIFQTCRNILSVFFCSDFFLVVYVYWFVFRLLLFISLGSVGMPGSREPSQGGFMPSNQSRFDFIHTMGIIVFAELVPKCQAELGDTRTKDVEVIFHSRTIHFRPLLNLRSIEMIGLQYHQSFQPILHIKSKEHTNPISGRPAFLDDYARFFLYGNGGKIQWTMTDRKKRFSFGALTNYLMVSVSR